MISHQHAMNMLWIGVSLAYQCFGTQAINLQTPVRNHHCIRCWNNNLFTKCTRIFKHWWKPQWVNSSRNCLLHQKQSIEINVGLLRFCFYLVHSQNKDINLGLRARSIYFIFSKYCMVTLWQLIHARWPLLSALVNLPRLVQLDITGLFILWHFLCEFRGKS